MNFKRPSFRRGGSTGIGQLSSNRQMYAGGGNIGGGTIAGSNLGTRTGFESIILQSSGLPFPSTATTTTAPTSNPIRIPKGSRASVNPFRISGYPNMGIARYMGQPVKYGPLAAYGAGIMAIPAGLAYMNKPETLAEKKVMQDYGPIDETFFDYDKYYADRKEASKVGDKISFSDALFMDPETGMYPEIFGRTKDRNKQAEIKKQEEDINIDMRGDPAQFSGEDELTDFDAIVKTMVSDKKTKTDTGEEKPEPTFEDTYQTEFDRIQKLVGDDNTKGMTAIALSEAIGTPGTIADKAAVLNKSLLGIMGNKRKDKKEIAMLAYKATKEIEKAKIVADKEGFSEKQFSRMMNLRRIVSDKTGTYNEEQKKNANAELSLLEQTVNSLGGKNKTGLGAGFKQGLDATMALDQAANKIIKYKGDKNSDTYKKMISEYNSALTYLAAQDDPSLNSAIKTIQTRLQNASGKKDGGRIERALGSPETGEMGTMPMSQTTNNSETPTAQVSKLSFQELRDRLPPEVTDDVIRFLSQSEQALQDFAYIRTAGDIKKFNMKYGLNLVLPAQA